MGRPKKHKAADKGGVTIDVQAALGNVDQQGNCLMDGLVEVSVLAMFIVQKLGQASLKDVAGKLADIHAVVDQHLLEQALEALRSRGFLSYASGRRPGAGEVERHWKTKKVVWASTTLEIAHIKDLLPALVATDGAQALIDVLNDREADGDGTSKATSRNKYDDYVDVKATFVTLDEFIGSQPASPHLDALCRKSPYNGVEAKLRFWRDAGDGALVIGSDCMRGWLRTGLRTKSLYAAAAEQVGIQSVKVRPRKPLTQTAFPIHDQRTGDGLGINTHETLQAGEEIVVLFRFPSRGFFTPDEFKRWLAGYAVAPLRGASPARGGRFGRMALKSWEVLGLTSDDRVTLRAALDVVPQECRALYEEMLAQASA